MRESEEYLIEHNLVHDDYETYVLKSDAEHAVKLAYKEGYLEAINDALDKIAEYGHSDQRITNILRELI